MRAVSSALAVGIFLELPLLTAVADQLRVSCQITPPPVPAKPDGTIEQRMAVELPIRFDQQIQSWDMAFKDTKNSDFVVG